MKIHHLHQWNLTLAQGLELQRSLARKVSKEGGIDTPHLVAGADISAPDAQDIATGAVVVVDYPQLTPVEIQVVKQKVEFPYVPGLLSFRESPLILAAFEKLASNPDLILVDGQGLAHPRRFGIACHLGLFLDLPTIGCAKSRLCGKHALVPSKPGESAQLMHEDEVIGVALCTKERTNPLYVSIGHKIGLSEAIHWTLQCCQGRRIPEPLRLAHLAAGDKLTMTPAKHPGLQNMKPTAN